MCTSVLDDNDLDILSRTLQEQSFVFVPRAIMLRLLTHNNNTLAQDVIEDFHQSWDTAVPQRSTANDEEVYPFKSTLVTYHNICASYSARTSTHDYNKGCHSVLGQCVFEEVDNTTSTQGKAAATFGRLHRAWPQNVDDNIIQKSLHKVIFDLLDTLHVTPTEHPEVVWECMQSAFRVTKSKERHGEPGPEGVHQDACVLTAIVLMDRTNVAYDTGGNRVWSLQQKSGKPTQDDLLSNKLLQEIVLRDQFDALFVLDRQVKHEALPIEIEENDNDGGVAIRDVVTFEVRVGTRTTNTCTVCSSTDL